MSPITREKNRIRNRLHYKNNPEYYKKWCRENIPSKLVATARQRALKRNIEFNITKEDVVLPTHCPILGIKLEYNQGKGAGGKDNSYSLDRVDNSKGYTKGNIQVISHKANSMKYTANMDELIKFSAWIQKVYNESLNPA